MLQTANFTQARDNFKNYCDEIVDSNATLIVTRKNDKHVVVQSLDNFNLMSNEILTLKKELYIHKRMVQAEKELAIGAVVPADDVFAQMRAIVEGKANVAI